MSQILPPHRETSGIVSPSLGSWTLLVIPQYTARERRLIITDHSLQDEPVIRVLYKYKDWISKKFSRAAAGGREVVYITLFIRK